MQYSSSLNVTKGVSEFNQSLSTIGNASFAFFIHPFWKQFDLNKPIVKAVFGTVIGLISLSATIGNGIVVGVFLSSKCLRTPPNIFIISLAISDMAFSLIMGFPLKTISSFIGYWNWGKLERTPAETGSISAHKHKVLVSNFPHRRKLSDIKKAIYGTNLIAAAKSKRAARRAQAPSTHNDNIRPLPSYTRCQLKFRPRIDLAEHLQAECNNDTATSTTASAKASILTLAANPTMPTTKTKTTRTTTTTTTATTDEHKPNAPPPSIHPTITSPTSATTTTFTTTTPTTGKSPPGVLSAIMLTTTAPTISKVDYITACTYCDCIVTPLGHLISHLRTYCTETSEPVPGAPTYTCHTHTSRPHCP
ncbi:Melanopsin [Sparganum proliferum]